MTGERVDVGPAARALFYSDAHFHALVEHLALIIYQQHATAAEILVAVPFAAEIALKRRLRERQCQSGQIRMPAPQAGDGP